MKLRRKINLVLATILMTAGVTLGTAQISEAKPSTIPCAYGHFCGVDGYGHSFDVSKCGVMVPIGLSGPGEFFNNQTPGTRAWWYGADGGSSGFADSGQHGYLDWTPVWWVKPC